MIEARVRRFCLAGMALAVAYGLPAQTRLELDEDNRRARVMEWRWEDRTPQRQVFSRWLELPGEPNDRKVQATYGLLNPTQWMIRDRGATGTVLTVLSATRDWAQFTTGDLQLQIDWRVRVDRHIRSTAWDRVGRRMFLLSENDELGVFDIPRAGGSDPSPNDFHWFGLTHPAGLRDAGIRCQRGVSAVQIVRKKRPGYGLDRGSWDFDAESGNWRSVALPYWFHDDRPRPQTRIEESARRGAAIESATLRNPVLRIALDGYAAVHPDLTLALLVDAPKPRPRTVVRNWVTARLDPGALSVLDVLPPSFDSGPRHLESLRLIQRTTSAYDVWLGHLDRVSIPTGVALHPARIWFGAVTVCRPTGPDGPWEWAATQEVAIDLGPVSPTRLVRTSPELISGMVGVLTGPWRHGPAQ